MRPCLQRLDRRRNVLHHRRKMALIETEFAARRLASAISKDLPVRRQASDGSFDLEARLSEARELYYARVHKDFHPILEQELAKAGLCDDPAILPQASQASLTFPKAKLVLVLLVLAAAGWLAAALSARP